MHSTDTNGGALENVNCEFYARIDKIVLYNVTNT